MTLSDLNLRYGQSIKLAIMALEHAARQATDELAEAPSNAKDICDHWRDRIAKTEAALAAVREALQPLETQSARATELPEVFA
jgi:hypothetical protein